MSSRTDSNSFKTFLINLPRATERRQKMEEQLAALNLPYELFNAVDGRERGEELLKRLDKRAFERNAGRKVLMGELGCYASHLEVWKETLASGAEFALVLEDDVVFHEDFLDAIELAISHARHWDYLKLNRIRAKIPVRQGKIGTYDLNAYLGPATGTGAYLIKASTIRKLMPGMLPITRPFDHELNRFFAHDFRLLGLEPFPSHIDDGGVDFIARDAGPVAKRAPFYHRLPNYRLRVANYFRRFSYLLRTGAWPGSNKVLE